MKTILKSTLLSLTAALFFSACAGDQDNVNTPNNAIASDATQSEIKRDAEYAVHVKKVKKSKKRRAKKVVKKEKSTKFCFKDSKSIHYKSSERCK